MKEINGLVKNNYQDVVLASSEANLRAVIDAINNNAHLLIDIYWRLEKIEKYIQENQNENSN